MKSNQAARTKRQSGLSCHLFALGTILIWSSAYTMTRVGLLYFTPVALSVFRYASASLFLLIWALFRREPLPARKDVPLFFLSGFLGFSAYVLLFNLGSQTLPAAVSSVLITTTTIFTALFALFLFRERISLLGWTAVAVEFCGVLVLCLWEGGLVFNRGIFWILCAALSLSGYNLIQRQLTRRYTPFQSTAYSIFAGTLLLLVLLPGALPQLKTAPANMIGTVVFLGIFPSAVAFVFWANAIKRAAKTSDVTNYMFLTPLLASVLDYTMLAEVPTPSAVWGGLLILAGLILFYYARERAEKPNDTVPQACQPPAE